MKTYGKFRYAPANDDRPRAVFGVAAEPYVMDLLRRVLPGATRNNHGQAVITATPENARKLEWLCDMYPLEPVDGESSAQLCKLADEYRNTEASLQRVLERGVGSPAAYVGDRLPALEPRDYQLVVPELLRINGGFLLGDELGLGKTFSTSLITCEEDALPCAVVAPQKLAKQWALEELPRYYPWARIHIVRKGSPYDVAKFRGKPVEPPHFLVFSYGMVEGWANHLGADESARKWGLPGKIQTVIFDEADALRTGPKTASGGSYRYEACKQLAIPARFVIGATGTPVHNRRDEMWNVADALQPGCLGTKDEFTRTWENATPRALGAYLRDRGIMLRRTRKDVGQELGPDPIELEQPVETDSKKLNQMMEKGIVYLAQRVLAGTREQQFTAGGQLEAQMRKATGVAKAPYVAAFAQMVLESEKKIILSGHHHDVYDIWRDLLEEFNPVMFTGRQTPKESHESKEAFINGGSRVLMLGVRVGAGINGLQRVCNTVIFGELDWTPPPHKQVIGRLNRDGQTTFPVMAHYMISDEGSDPVMADVLQIKKNIAHPIVDPDAELLKPSPDEAARRTRLLAEAVLRKHGIDPATAGPPLPTPEPGGSLISRETLRNRLNGGGRP